MERFAGYEPSALIKSLKDLPSKVASEGSSYPSPVELERYGGVPLRVIIAASKEMADRRREELVKILQKGPNKFSDDELAMFFAFLEELPKRVADDRTPWRKYDRWIAKQFQLGAQQGGIDKPRISPAEAKNWARKRADNQNLALPRPWDELVTDVQSPVSKYYEAVLTKKAKDIPEDLVPSGKNPADLNSWTFKALKPAMMNLFSVKDTGADMVKKWVEEGHRGNAEIFDEDNNFLVVKIPKGHNDESVKAMSSMGEGTGWCTATDPKYQKDYIEQGPLYIYYDKSIDPDSDKDPRVAQAHFQTGQIMDQANDYLWEKDKALYERMRPSFDRAAEDSVAKELMAENDPSEFGALVKDVVTSLQGRLEDKYEKKVLKMGPEAVYEYVSAVKNATS